MVEKTENGLSLEANVHLLSRTRLRNLVLVTFLFLCFFALISGASAANFNSSSTNAEIQAFLSNTTTTDNEVVFSGGTYNQITGLTVSRSVNISSTGQVNIESPSAGTLFTITAPNVKIVNLNISAYNLAINSNQGNLSVIGCNMSTIDRSIHLSGASLTGVLLENNTIISSVNSTSYGAVYVNATDGSVVNIAVKGNNILGNGTSNSTGVRFDVVRCNNTLFFENNNITGLYGVDLYAHTNSNNTITITNNNITGTSYPGVYLGAYTSNNTITITNNNITGPYGVYLYAYTNSNNTITITNNNITGTYGVYLRAETSNNTITITNNNITGNNYGVYLVVYTNSNNNITITNNNITGTSGYGVYLGAYTNSNNTITITNNNITGNNYGVDLSAYTNSNNTITITNNNITGLYGVDLYAHTNSNNTITITNNNITGTSYPGVYLGAYTSNNTITITNNNITGPYGVYLYAYTNSNNTITITNNNITGTDGAGVYLEAYTNSNNTITITNNNITGRSYGVYLNAYTSNNTITITNNNITGTGTYGVYLVAYTNSNNTITITNNNITGTSAQGVYLVAYTSNNNITITNNNITGTTGVYLVAYTNSNNTITITNNNITGTYGVELRAYTNSNNTITITNNNITGISGYGVYLGASSSNNNITITNNNITGTSGYGVELYAYTSNNTITITNNNITGNNYGVYLGAYSSNNNITITNNNITGTSGYGVYLGADSSNNTALSFIGNNITGNNYAMCIYSYQQLSGLSLLNNTFVSSDIGLYFVLDSATLSDILVKGNTINATNTGIGFEEYSPSSVSLTVNYNRILADVGLNFTTTDAGSNFDYNWWGINDITGKVVGFDTNNHYILNITNLTSLDNVRVGDKVNFALLVLNTTLTNDGVENLPYFVITGTFNGVSYSSDRDDSFVHQFTISSEGLQTIDASLDEEYVALEFNASKRNSSSTIVVPDDVRVGKTIDITGVVTDNDGNPVANRDISVTVDGKTYSVTTDSNGRWTLSYKPTHTGNVNVSVSWTENNIYNGFTNNTSFNVKKGNIIVTITVTENPDGSILIIANATDEDRDPVSGHPVDFVLDGKTVGHEVTDSNGIATITIPASKLSNGTHIITVIVGGDDNFNDGIVSIEFTVTEPNNDTNDTNNTSNNSATAGAAAMKETGMPMVVFLILAVLGFATYRRKW